jgi:hypothetical protein
MQGIMIVHPIGGVYFSYLPIQIKFQTNHASLNIKVPQIKKAGQ